MQPEADGADKVLSRLAKGIQEQRDYLVSYEKPSEVVAFETLRAFDDLFFRDQMLPEQHVEKNERLFRELSTFGVNQALRRVIPKSLSSQPFKELPSTQSTRDQVDDFVFACGVLELGLLCDGSLRDGVLNGEIRHHTNGEVKNLEEVLVLRKAISSYSDEEIGMTGLRWSSRRVQAIDNKQEKRLEKRHRKMFSDLEKRVDLLGGWRVHFTSTPEIDQYFVEWARLYLRRIYSQELLTADDKIGGRPFSNYVEVLSLLSGMSQQRIANASILIGRYPAAHIRNLLTAFSDRGTLIVTIARRLDAERKEIEEIIKSLTLFDENLDAHTLKGQAAWAPIVQASENTYLLPNFGLEIDPFLFLFADLKSRYEKDWFRLANEREGRWIEEFGKLFVGPRWQTNTRNLKLRSGGKIETDIDFAVFDRKTNELALFQLKWQHPVGYDDRARRSARTNFVKECNRWVNTVTSWLDRFGAEELQNRLGFDCPAAPKVLFFVLGRYHAHYAGFDDHDSRAIWSDWAHFRRVRIHGPKRSLSQLAADLQSEINRSRKSKKGQSLMFPIGDLPVILNPTAEPET
jgi:hypothetical protein